MFPEPPEITREIERSYGLRDRIVLLVATLCRAKDPRARVHAVWWWTRSPQMRAHILAFCEHSARPRDIWPEPRPGMLHDCPCCGLPTLASRADYDICSVCWWEDDGTDGSSGSSPNHGETLSSVMPHVARHLLMHRPDGPRFAEFGGADPVVRAARVAVRDAADRCRGLPDGPDYDAACIALTEALAEVRRRTSEHLDRRHGREATGAP